MLCWVRTEVASNSCEAWNAFAGAIAIDAIIALWENVRKSQSFQTDKPDKVTTTTQTNYSIPALATEFK